jgi:competence ComEA-like helix-hairpin-helix protein
MEHGWKDYFSFSKKERRGIVTLLALIGISVAIPEFLPDKDKEVVQALEEWREIVADSVKRRPVPQKERHRQPVVLFPFDPNTLDSAGWLKLGVHPRSIHTIRKYVNKGGRFRKPEDLERIYGFRDYDRLHSYIKIVIEEKYVARERPAKPTPSIIDVNTADTAAFIALPGIGAKLAQRIITFREKLGGFYSIEQIKETYGLQDSTFQLIKPLLSCIPNTKKININTADVTILKQHPYIKWPIANAIIQYRNQHGPFSSLQDLQKIVLLNDTLYAKIIGYISLE